MKNRIIKTKLAKTLYKLIKMLPIEIIDHIVNLGYISTLKHTLLISSKYKNKAVTLIVKKLVDEVFSERPIFCIVSTRDICL